MMIVFQPKKTILPQRTKKSCVIEEVKAKFFATTIKEVDCSKLLKIK